MMNKSTIITALDIRTALPAGASIDEAFVQKVMVSAGIHLHVSGEVSISFVDDEEMHALNREYRNVDRTTDVLSFALQEGEDEFPMPASEGPQMLGDIVVSIPKAIEQAEDYGHSIEREIGFLLVHGFLHLLGYDHDTEDAEQEMFGLQERILADMGLKRGETQAP